MAQNLERIWEMGQNPADRPDLLDRMYSQLMKLFLRDLTKTGVMGKANAWVDVFERQMRCLWNCHISLLTADMIPESEVDFWIRAQLPDPNDPEEKEYY